VRAESGELTERRTSSKAASVWPWDVEPEPAVFSTRIELESCAVGKCPGAASTAHAADRSLPGESWDATDGSLGKCAVRHKYPSAFLQQAGPNRRGAAHESRRLRPRLWREDTLPMVLARTQSSNVVERS